MTNCEQVDNFYSWPKFSDPPCITKTRRKRNNASTCHLFCSKDTLHINREDTTEMTFPSTSYAQRKAGDSRWEPGASIASTLIRLMQEALFGVAAFTFIYRIRISHNISALQRWGHNLKKMCWVLSDRKVLHYPDELLMDTKREGFV